MSAAAVAAASVALLAAPAADASFTTAKCGGSAVNGAGSSFQNAAQSVFNSTYTATSPAASVFCGGLTPQGVTYTGGGSGLGRRHMGERTSGGSENNVNGSQSRSYAERVTGSDDPLSATAKSQIEQGTDTAGDEAKIHQIPVAVGAIVPLVNFPTDCDVKSLPTANQTDPTAVDGTDRVRFNRQLFENIWNGSSSFDSWGDVFPTIAAVDTDPATAGAQNPTNRTDASCKAQAITRVVRFDESGSTYALKDALNKYNPSRHWLPDRVTGPDTRNWGDGIDNGQACNGGLADPSKAGPIGTNLVTACASGGGAEVTKVKGTDGSIGYVDLDTAVNAGLQLVPQGGSNPADPNPDTYWTQIPNGSDTFTEPTKTATAYKANADGSNATTDGANCFDTVFTGVPTSTLGDWSATSGTNSASGFGICTMSWDLAFDDDATAYPLLDATAEEKKARTVKDYLTNAVSQTTQNALIARNYAPLNTSLRTIAQAGVDAIGWNKAGTSGGGGGGGVVVTAPPNGAGSGSGGSQSGALPINKPSNVFSVPRVSLSSKSGTATFSVLVPGAGTLKIEPTATVVSASSSAKKKAKSKKVKLGTITRTVSKGGTVKITLKPTGSALKALKKAGKLKVAVKVTFTPKGGTARSSTKTITLKYKKPAKKKRG